MPCGAAYRLLEYWRVKVFQAKQLKSIEVAYEIRMRTIDFNTPAGFQKSSSDNGESAMTDELSQQVENQQEKQSYDLESLKRELWMRLLGMKAGTQSTSSPEPNSMIWPRYMTATRLLICLIALRLWATNR